MSILHRVPAHAGRLATINATLSARWEKYAHQRPQNQQQRQALQVSLGHELEVEQLGISPTNNVVHRLTRPVCDTVTFIRPGLDPAF